MTLDIECPKCGAAPGARCWTLATKRTTDTHSARYDAWWTRHDERRASLPPHISIIRHV